MFFLDRIRRRRVALPPVLIITQSPEVRDWPHYGQAIHTKKKWLDRYPPNFETNEMRLHHLKQSLVEREQGLARVEAVRAKLQRDVKFLRAAVRVCDIGTT